MRNLIKFENNFLSIAGQKTFQNVTIIGNCQLVSINKQHFDNVALVNQQNNFTEKVIFQKDVLVKGNDNHIGL